MKRKALTSLLVSVLVLASAGPALAGTNYGSRISLGYSPASGGQFTGNVQSRSVCASGRRVAVYLIQPGADRTIGQARTSAGGSWRLQTGKPKRGNYYAAALPSTVAGGVRCGSSRSAVTHVS